MHIQNKLHQRPLGTKYHILSLKNSTFLSFMFRGPCIVTYLRNKNQQDALFYSQFISIINFYVFRAGLLVLYIQQLVCVSCCIYRQVPPDDEQ